MAGELVTKNGIAQTESGVALSQGNGPCDCCEGQQSCCYLDCAIVPCDTPNARSVDCNPCELSFCGVVPWTVPEPPTQNYSFSASANGLTGGGSNSLTFPIYRHQLKGMRIDHTWNMSGSTNINTGQGALAHTHQFSLAGGISLQINDSAGSRSVVTSNFGDEDSISSVSLVTDITGSNGLSLLHSPLYGPTQTGIGFAGQRIDSDCAPGPVAFTEASGSAESVFSLVVSDVLFFLDNGQCKFAIILDAALNGTHQGTTVLFQDAPGCVATNPSFSGSNGGSATGHQAEGFIFADCETINLTMSSNYEVDPASTQSPPADLQLASSVNTTVTFDPEVSTAEPICIATNASAGPGSMLQAITDRLGIRRG